jgi:P4 family phage/plasmid primase-like protien
VKVAGNNGGLTMAPNEIPKIPEQLKGWRFVKVKPHSKVAFEEKWPTTANYAWDDPALLKHIESGGNYGVMGGPDRLIVDGDVPEIQEAVEKMLPPTFTVRTPGHQGKHFYFYCMLARSFRLKDKDGVNRGDVQGRGKQVLGPGSVHPNGGEYTILVDRPIAQISEEELREALSEFTVREDDEDKIVAKEALNLEVSGIHADMKITDIVKLDDKEWHKRGDEYYGPPPGHDSKSKKSFWINVVKNCWHCFKHDTGGGPLSLLAIKEGLLRCDEGGKALRGKTFRLIINLAAKRGLIKESDNPLLLYFDMDGKFLPKRLADKIMETHDFVTHRESRTIYRYHDGCYTPDGEVAIREVCRQKLGELARDYQINEVIKHIQDTTFRQPEDFNPPINLICLENGVLDLDTLELSPHTPDLIFLNKVPCRYDTNAKAPLCGKHFSEWMCEDDIIRAIQFIGFCLRREYFIRKTAIGAGEGGNGKSTFVIYLASWLGGGNVCSIPVQDLDTNRFSRASLEGKLANICDDLPSTEWYETGAYKQATGGAPIQAERKFQHPFNFFSHAKMMFTANRLPLVNDDTRAFWERIMIISFPNHFDGKMARMEILAEMLTPDERSGVLNAALAGLKMLLQAGEFYRPEDLDSVRSRYIHMSDPVAAFKEDCVEEDPKGRVEKAELYDAYVKYCQEHGFSPAINAVFARLLKRVVSDVRGRRPKIEGERVEVWDGVRLKTEEEREADEDKSQKRLNIEAVGANVGDVRDVKGFGNSMFLHIQKIEEILQIVEKTGVVDNKIENNLDNPDNPDLPTAQELQNRFIGVLRQGPLPPNELDKHFTDDELKHLNTVIERLRQSGKLLMAPNEDGKMSWGLNV